MSNILDSIQTPQDIKKLSIDELLVLATEIRQRIIDTVATKEGHLGASLGVVELTLALHYVFDSPDDSLIWDVGHQAYGHKIITGRKDIFSKNRQKDGISGFPKIAESKYDAFGVGHSSTSISAALGMAIADQLNGNTQTNHIAVIGDASIAAGMAFEGLNHAGATDANLLVVLNDNAIGIDPSVGALKDYLTAVKEGKNHKANNMIKSLNFDYTGPLDGHDLNQLITVLQRLKARKGPKFLHVITTKGKGLKQAEENQVLYHAPGPFDKITGELIKPSTVKLPKYQEVFGHTLCEMARYNQKLFAITPAMPTGSSLKFMMDEFPERAIDVGIAEQHAVTLGAGIALKGFKVYCCIYSTFLQRAYDQVIHDVALQNIPLVFCIDRAGLVGEDGATHQGVFDIAFLNAIPNITIWSPKNAKDLRQCLYNSQFFTDGPLAIRYPRGYTRQTDWQIPFEKQKINKLESIREGKKILIISTGTIFEEVEKALDLFNQNVSHYHLAQIKPLECDKIKTISSNYDVIVTVEEGAIIGGMGQSISKCLSSSNKVYHLGVPDRFIEHATYQQQLQECGLDAHSIVNYLEKILNELD